MAIKICTYDIDNEKIHLKGINCLVKLLKYNHQKPLQMYKGAVLADDLLDDKGAALYSVGKSIMYGEVGTLLKLSTNYPESFSFDFKLQPTPELLAHFRKEILLRMKKLIEHRSKYRIYSNFFGPIMKQMGSFMQQVLRDDALVIRLFQMKYNSDNASAKTASQFFNHAVSTAIFSYGLVNFQELSQQIDFTEEDKVDLVKAAFLYSYGAVCSADKIVGLQDQHKKDGFRDENRSTAEQLESVGLGMNTFDAILFVNEYAFGSYDIVEMTEKPTWMANIIIAVNLYLQEETGILGVKNKIKDIVDSINVKAVNKQANIEVAQSLALALKFDELFDFYQEIDMLVATCDKSSAVPYPMTGLGSPTIFVCKHTRKDCKYFEVGSTAVNLITRKGDLDPGKYNRCSLTTPRLQAFYDKHYSDIKEEKVTAGDHD